MMTNYSDGCKIACARNDLQHHILRTLIIYFRTARMARADNATLQMVLGEILAYYELHQQNEEQLMKDISFPDFESHKKNHDIHNQDFIKKIQGVEKGDYAYADFDEYLSKWIVEHITHEDAILRKYLKQLQKY